MTFGEKLQDLRKKGGMSQDILAEKLEVSRQAVSKWERDEAMPETDKLLRIAQLFGVSTDYLLSNETPSPPPQSYSHNTTNRVLQRLERFIRRHGYKGGYLIGGIGLFIDFIALLFRGIWRSSVSSMTGGFGDLADSVFSDSNIPGFNMGNSMFDQFQQQADKMESMAANLGNIYLILLIPGTAMIALGIYVIFKGKKLAKESITE